MWAAMRRTIGIDAVFAVGELSRDLSRACRPRILPLPARHFDTKEELLEALPLLLLKGDSILVKASHFMEFPEIVSFLEKEGNR